MRFRTTLIALLPAALALALANCGGNLRPVDPPIDDDAGHNTTPPPSGHEVCADGIDNNGDQKIDENCGCGPGATQTCYSGAASARGVGLCVEGKQTCNGDGEFGSWGECEGSVVPVAEVCDDTLDNDCDGDVDEECGPPPPTTPTHTALPCTTQTMSHVYGSGDCAPGMAVFMMDDGNGPNFVCCPLPATDILSSAPAITRTIQCAENEVITGATRPLTFRCTLINTARYQLGSVRQTCYFGGGDSGNQGVGHCPDHPHSFSALHQRLFGSDGCSGWPYGSLIWAQGGRYCKDMFTKQLQYKGTVSGDPAAGTPVVMYQDS